MGKPEKIVAVAIVIVIVAAMAIAIRRAMPAPAPPPEIKIVPALPYVKPERSAAQKEVDAIDARWAKARDDAMRAWPAVKAETEGLCRDAFREKMAHLEPDGDFVMKVGMVGDYELFVKVRLTDSFRAAPVGIVKCSVTPGIPRAFLEKVRM